MNARHLFRLAAMNVIAVAIMAVNPTFGSASRSACVGDCNGDNSVTVDEIVTMVNIALGIAEVSSCTAGDANGSRSITVDEIITALNNALTGCPPPPTATVAVSNTPADTETPTETPTEPATTETPAPTEAETEGPTETETPEPTPTNGMMPATATAEVTPTDTPENTPTEPEPTDTPEPTETPEEQPTNTVAIEPTDTPEPMPTDTPGGGIDAAINLSSTSGSAGANVVITATLVGSEDTLTATSNDIFYDTTKVNVVQNPDIACTINPGLGQGTPFAKMLLLNVAPQTGTTARLRIGLISFSSSLALPDGLLFSCQFAVAAEASGTIVLENHPEGSDALGDSVVVGGSHGMITVE